MGKNRSMGTIWKGSGILMSLFVFVLYQSFIGLFIVPWVEAQTRIDIPSSFNPVGSGARALGMGGSFIAVADDATAASWNPGGLIQLERPEMSIVVAGFLRTEDLEFGVDPWASGHQTVKELRCNYMSAAYPFTLFGSNMIVSINYQNLYDLTREWNFPLNTSEGALNVSQRIDYENQGTLSAYGLLRSVLQVQPA